MSSEEFMLASPDGACVDPIFRAIPKTELIRIHVFGFWGQTLLQFLQQLCGVGNHRIAGEPLNVPV